MLHRILRSAVALQYSRPYTDWLHDTWNLKVTPFDMSSCRLKHRELSQSNLGQWGYDKEKERDKHIQGNIEVCT